MPLRRTVRKLSSNSAIDTPMPSAIAVVVISEAKPAAIRVFFMVVLPLSACRPVRQVRFSQSITALSRCGAGDSISLDRQTEELRAAGQHILATGCKMTSAREWR
jgi:hypothetical protein